MGTVIQDARASLATVITNAGLTCLQYQEDRIPTQLPAADIWLEGFDVAERYDQKFGFGRLSFVVSVYQHAGPRVQKAQQYQDANIALVMSALGADRTLTGDVADCVITSARSYVARSEKGQSWMVTEIGVSVTPFANVA